MAADWAPLLYLIPTIFNHAYDGCQGMPVTHKVITTT